MTYLMGKSLSAPPVYQAPLSEQVEELRIAQSKKDSTVLELTELILLGASKRI